MIKITMMLLRDTDLIHALPKEERPSRVDMNCRLPKNDRTAIYIYNTLSLWFVHSCYLSIRYILITDWSIIETSDWLTHELFQSHWSKIITLLHLKRVHFLYVYMYILSSLYPIFSLASVRLFKWIDVLIYKK